MRRIMKLILIGAFLTVSLMPIKAQAAESEYGREVKKQCLSPAKVQLKGDLRKLWIDHIIWTRAYTVSALAGLEDQEKVLARLLKNQQDIGNAMKPFYGEAAGNKLAELLREHIVVAGRIVEALKAGNQADVEKYNKEWYRNADDIAMFLSKANPHWSNQELQTLLYKHLQLLTDDLTARVKKDYDAEITAFDKGEEHIIMLADTLTEGIIKQFPDRFK